MYNANLFSDILRICIDLFQALVALVITNRHLSSVLRGWEGPFPIFFLFTAEAFEVIFFFNISLFTLL
jgi:hypothetical protein